MNVDEVWQQLKARQTPSRQSRAGVSLSGFAGLPGITSHVRTYDKSKGPAQPEARPAGFIAQLRQQGSEERQGTAESSADQHQGLLASLQRDINGLSDPDRGTRRRAVDKLHMALLSSGRGASHEALQSAVAGPLLIPLVQLLADPAEKCRELATTFFSAALQRLPQPGALLPTLVPALAERVGTPPVQETSEEMRLALAELVAGALLARAPRPFPADLLPPLCATVCCQLQDAYADIKKAACTAVAIIAELAGAQRLPQPLLQPMVWALAANLAHQHSRVRLTSLQALHALVQHGMPLELLEENVLPAVRPLAHDHASAIRSTLFSCVAQWAGSQLPVDAATDAADDGRMANQCRTFLPLLLPLLLLGLTDEAEAIRSDSYAQMEAIGAHMASQASPAVAQPSSMALDQPQQLPGYCHPFSAGRPSLVARCVVQSQLSRLLQQALSELREWTATLRVSAVRLLRATLIYGEEEVLPQLPTVLHALRGAVADDDAGVVSHAVGCVHVLGVNLPARRWMPLAAEGVTAEQQSAKQRTSALVVLSGLLHAASKAGSEVHVESLQLAVAALSKAQQAVAAGSAADEDALQHQSLAACFNLVQWARPTTAAIAPQLFQVLLQLWAAQADSQLAASSAGAAAAPINKSGDSRSISSLTAEGVLSQLAMALGKAAPADLCKQYGRVVLQAGLQGHEQWTHAHPNWRTLAALLRLCNSSGLLQLWPQVLPVLYPIAASHERDPRLRLELFQLLAMLLEDDSKGDAWQQGGTGQLLVRQLLIPGLVWRVGRVQVAMRYAILTALATMLSRQRLPPDQLAHLGAAEEGTDLKETTAVQNTANSAAPAEAEGPAEAQVAATAADGQAAGGQGLLARVAGCLDEDFEPDTRQLACHVVELLLSSVGPNLSAQQLTAVQPELLRRLDDGNNRVRVAACAAFQPWLRNLLGRPNGLTDADASSLASALLIHLDDPDDAVGEAACSIMEQLATARPGVVRPLVQAVMRQHSRRILLIRVLAACDM